MHCPPQVGKRTFPSETHTANGLLSSNFLQPKWSPASSHDDGAPKMPFGGITTVYTSITILQWLRITNDETSNLSG